MKNNKKIPDLDKYIIFSIMAIIIYTMVAYITIFFTGYSLDVLTTVYFGFFGGEITICAIIKKLKLKKENNLNNEEGINDEQV